MSPAATCLDRLQERMRSIWETERTGKACVRASSALGIRGENILPPNPQDGCPSARKQSYRISSCFPEAVPVFYDGRRDLALDADNGDKTNSNHRSLP
jgi:hypothetical protein